MNLLADALSAALVHSLWQNTIVAILLWMALAVLGRRSANARYAVSCAALAMMVAVPMVTAAVLYERALPLDGATTVMVGSTPVIPANSTAIGLTPVTSGIQEGNWISWLQVWALPIWFAGVLVFSLRLVAATAHAMALKRRSEPADEALASIVSALATRMGVTRSVTVLISTITGSPATLGWIRPVILLPPATALGITPRQLEALLAHELAHIRRHDYLVNVLQMISETVFFYHPAVWWASRRIRVERELCCDDIAIESCGDALGYAQALTRVARLRLTTADMAVGSSGGPLLRRIQRVLGTASSGRTISPGWLVATSLVMAVAVMLTGVRAQSPTPGAPTSGMKEAMLRGRVIDAGTGQPVSGASVRAQYVTGVENPTTCPIDDCSFVFDKVVGRIPMYRQSTGSDGRFEIRGVRPGDYFVLAAAPGYIQRHFGQTSGDMPEVAVNAPAGQTASAVDIRLERAGAVTGRIFSDAGDGLFGVEVELLRRRYLPGGTRQVAVAFAQTEDLGVFRFRDVAPGEYYVRAYVPESIRPTRADKSFAYAATFFPEAPDIETAQPLVIAGGQELFGIDFSLATMKMRAVSGRLVDPAGRSLATASVRLMQLRNGPVETPRSAVTRDGQFRLEGVTPGNYMLLVFDTADGRRWNDWREISVVDDVTDLLLVAGPAASIAGHIVREDDRPLPFDVSDLDISLEQRPAPGTMYGSGRADVRADGTFSIQSGAGTMHLQVGGLSAPWNVNAATLDGVEVTDRPFELRGGGRHRLEITLTDRVVRLVGTVTDRSARPVSNVLVLVFPEDRSRWGTSRLIRTTFSHQQGGYELGDLPAANYRAVAVAALPRLAWMDPAVLDRLWPSSTAIRLQEGQQQGIPLRVIPAPVDLIQ